MNALAAEGFVGRGPATPCGRSVGAGLLEIKSVEPWTILLDSRSR
jgi:hypothetical protein